MPLVVKVRIKICLIHEMIQRKVRKRVIEDNKRLSGIRDPTDPE